MNNYETTKCPYSVNINVIEIEGHWGMWGRKKKSKMASMFLLWKSLRQEIQEYGNIINVKSIWNLHM